MKTNKGDQTNVEPLGPVVRSTTTELWMLEHYIKQQIPVPASDGKKRNIIIYKKMGEIFLTNPDDIEDVKKTIPLTRESDLFRVEKVVVTPW